MPQTDDRPAPGAGSLYAQADAALLDYGEAYSAAFGAWVRGPLPPEDPDTPFVLCLGGASTYGRYVARPWPALLAESLPLAVANLGFGAFAPAHLLHRPDLYALAQRARLVVLQIPTARFEPNGLLRPEGDGWSLRLGWRRRRVETPAEGYRLALEKLPLPRVAAALRESQKSWVRRMRVALARLGPRTLLLWFSRRDMETPLNPMGPGPLAGGYPQLVESWMVERIRGQSAGLVAAVTDRGWPQVLGAGADGTPLENRYYPSPEMHEDAARRLIETIVDRPLLTPAALSGEPP